jgi:hypothetical protein
MSGHLLMIAGVAVWLPRCFTGMLACRTGRKIERRDTIPALVQGALVALSSWGGSSTGTPAGISTVQVTLAGEGNLTRTVKQTLTVQ